MGYYIRFFTTQPLGTLVPVHAQMHQRGYQVNPAGTNQLDVIYDSKREPVQIDMSDSTSPTTREDVRAFIDVVSRVSGEPEQARVLDVLARTQAVIAVGVPDDYDEQSGTVFDVIEIIANAAVGLFQVDGEGFYDGAQLILRL
ncbi:MAG TPA: hypothetical protein VJZ27_13210 [Aggregatilineales bacterium]|nr:hypothetical protein [Aggregatilineales bacterium]